jgi:N-acetylglucosaminyl-diphospho-decaprenol L-rhamnosyltransferase
MGVSVVIGNFEGEQLLPDCLASLESQSLRPDEVIVVDAGSRDRSRAVAEAAGATVLDAPNRGLGSLYNRGTAAAAGEHVLLANNDVAFEEHCIERLAAALEEDPARFAADPTQLDWAGAEVIHARTVLRRGRLLREFIPGLNLDHLAPSESSRSTVSAHGAAMLVRRSMFLELGGFDETFFMEWEDLDLCWRAWLSGWSSVYVPHARLRHRVGAVTTSRILPRRLASSHHNLVRFALKCLPARAAARVVLGEVLRLPRHPRIVAPALVRVALELPEIGRLRRQAAPRGELFEWMLAGQPA